MGESRVPSGREIDEEIWTTLQRAANWPAEGDAEEYREWALSYIRDARSFRLVIDFVLRLRDAGRIPERFTLLDVGTSLGVIPLTLMRFGAEASACDLPTRSGTHLAQEGIAFSPVDLEDGDLPYGDSLFDVVVCKDTVEHLPFGPKQLFESVHRILKPDGFFVLSCPNIARVSTRARLLVGKSVHQPLDDWYNTEPPFRGHFREYTLKELQTMLDWAGFVIVESRRVNYQDVGSLVRERRLSPAFPRFHNSDKRAIAFAAWEGLARVVPAFAQHNFVVARKRLATP